MIRGAGAGPRVPGPPDPLALRDLARHLSLVSHLGLTMAAAIGIGLALGHGLDHWLGLGGWGKALGIPLGIASGFWAVYQLVAEAGREPR